MSTNRMLEVQTRVIEIIAPHMTGWLTRQEDTAKCAANTLVAVQNAGISYQELFQAFPHGQVLLEVAHRLGVPKLADPWLNKYYADLGTQAASELRRNSGGR